MATSTTRLDWDEAAAPATPAASRVRVYAKADGLMYSKDDAGVETLMSSGAGSGIAATIFDAKGDIIAASAADTAARVAVGANGTVLFADSGATAGVAWKTPTKFVVSAGSSVSSTSFADTDLTFAVAASSTYVFVMHVYFVTNATTVGIRLAINGPAGATGRFGIYVPTTANSDAVSIGVRQGTALDTAIRATVAGPGASGVYAIVSGSMVVGVTAGNLVLRHASETATQTDVEAGSWGECSLVI